MSEYEKLKIKYPNKIPIIVKPSKNCKIKIFKNKYLVDKTMPISQFINIVRTNIKLRPGHAIFITINGMLAPSNEEVGQLYIKNKLDDNFLHIEYSLENTFG